VRHSVNCHNCCGSGRATQLDRRRGASACRVCGGTGRRFVDAEGLAQHCWILRCDLERQRRVRAETPPMTDDDRRAERAAAVALWRERRSR